MTNLPAIPAEQLLIAIKQGLEVAASTTKATEANAAATRGLMAFGLVFPDVQPAASALPETLEPGEMERAPVAMAGDGEAA